MTEDGSLKTGKIGEAVAEGYKKIEAGVVEGYKKIETGAVEGFTKVSDGFVEKLFAREGESVEDAKKRLSGETEAEDGDEASGEDAKN
ncbi:MAG: hypothetical protein IJD13_03965 [Oscillospiraceae bacterium]|nr:hypothetical protein [Oscillospiraceae bacterium]